jgi:hypothetical protein
MLAASMKLLQAGYADTYGRVKSPAAWCSVVDQLSFLLPGYLERVTNQEEEKAAKSVVGAGDSILNPLRS